MKKTTLKYPHADLDEMIYDPERCLDTRIIQEPFKCKWAEQGQNQMITDQAGPEKSICPMRWTYQLCDSSRPWKYCKASQLINELDRAEARDTYQEALAHQVPFDLLVTDDFGLTQLDLNKCRNLY